MSSALCRAAIAGLVLAACPGCGSTQRHSGGAGGRSSGGVGGGGADAGGKSAGGTSAGGTPAIAGSAGSAGAHAGGGGGGDGGAASACDLFGVPGTCVAAASCDVEHTSSSGLCSSTDRVCCTPFGALLCDPNRAPRPDPNAGKTTEAPGVGGCPDGMVTVSTFCIDRYEATLVRIDTGETWCPYDNPGSVSLRALSVAGTVPQAYIDQIQAQNACANAGKRLCTDAEWLRACRGPNSTTYPYGDTRVAGQCNDERKLHPAVQYFGTSDSWIYSELGNGCLDQLPQTTAPTGEASDCVTADGVYDMVGNVDEWTSDPNGTFRGGSFVDSAVNGAGCSYVTTAHDTLHWDFTTGFRCCSDPP